MALITCPECGQQISDRAKVCPHCGCPVEATDSAKIPAAAPAPGAAILELPGLHPKMKTAEEWVVADDAGKKILANITWGETRQMNVHMSKPMSMWVIPRNQLADKRRLWWGNVLGAIVALIIAYGIMESTMGDSDVGSIVNILGFLGLVGYLIVLFRHRRSKHLHFIASPGKRYSLIWKNRHTFSVSEYDA